MEKTRSTSLLKRWQYRLNQFQNHRTYIIPTRLGIYYAVLCFLLLGVAFIYNNNVAYFCCFALVSLGITSLFQTNYNMDRIKITPLAIPETHAEHPVSLRYLVENSSHQPSYHFDCFLDAKNKSPRLSTDSQFSINKRINISHLKPKDTLEIEFPIIFNERGYHPLPTLVIEATFPFGLFKSWKLQRSTEKALIFPAKKGNLPLPTIGSSQYGDLIQEFVKQERGAEFYGHRPHQHNDSYRHVDWKAYARANKLIIKLFDNEEQGLQILSWNQTQSLGDLEQRISQITQWISLCQKQKKEFILEMPGWTQTSSSTKSSYSECYRFLALFQRNPSDHPQNSESNHHHFSSSQGLQR